MKDMKILSMKALARQIRGVSYKPEDLHDGPDSSSIMLLRANNIGDGRINFKDVVYVDRTRVSQEQLLQKGDILICASSGSKSLVGKAATFDLDMEVTFGAFCKVVRPNDTENMEYISMFFQSPHYRHEISTVAIGANINNIRNEHIDALQVQWPSDESRKSAVAILSKTDSIIRYRKGELQALDNLIKARFVEMFGSPDLGAKKPDWKPISSIGTVVGGATPKTSIPEYWDGEYRWITPAELDNASGYIYDSARKLTEAGIKSCSLTEMPVGTVILSSRAPIGKVAIAGNTFYCNQGFKNIICGDGIHPVFLYSLLCMNSDYLNSLGRGATFKEISKSIVENILIPVPSMENQEEYASFVAQVDKSRVVVQKALNEVQLLFDSLMQNYFG